MTCVPAPACKAALSQATDLWPNRNRASDGICPSPQHTKASPTSDHERGEAVDLTHDPARGCDAHRWAEDLRQRRDPRVKYIISNRKICSSSPTAGYPAWAWRPYSGANPHSSHVHVSIKSTARNDTSPWFTAPAPPAQQEDDDLTADQAADLLATKNYAIAAHQKASDAVNYAVDLQSRLVDVQAKLDQLLAKHG